MTIIFTSHGAPDIIASENATTRFWRGLFEPRATPKRFIVVSAHWCTETPMIGAHENPATVHDFGGFADALYQLRYPVKGDPEYALALSQKLSQFNLQLSPSHGLDHGVWIPLMAMRPQADIAVIPLSLPMSYSLTELWQFGEALREVLSDDDCLICSGASSHNLRAIFSAEQNVEPKVNAFRQWLIPNVLSRDQEALINYRRQAPEAVWNHPSDEHFRPLFIASGAAPSSMPEHFLSETTYGILPMDHFVWA